MTERTKGRKRRLLDSILDEIEDPEGDVVVERQVKEGKRKQ